QSCYPAAGFSKTRRYPLSRSSHATSRLLSATPPPYIRHLYDIPVEYFQPAPAPSDRVVAEVYGQYYAGGCSPAGAHSVALSALQPTWSKKWFSPHYQTVDSCDPEDRRI